MKHFLVFGGYYGDWDSGWHTMLMQCDNMTEVKEFLDDWYGDFKWYHVVDSSTGKIFMESPSLD